MRERQTGPPIGGLAPTRDHFGRRVFYPDGSRRPPQRWHRPRPRDILRSEERRGQQREAAEAEFRRVASEATRREHSDTQVDELMQRFAELVSGSELPDIDATTKGNFDNEIRSR